MYISTRTWPGPLTLILYLLNILKYLFLSEGSVQWTSTNPSYGELFPPALSLLFYIAHQSFSLDCLIQTSALLKKCIRLLSTSSGVVYTHICSFNLPKLKLLYTHFHLNYQWPTPSTPAFQKHYQLPTVDLLLNSFGVGLLFIETPSYLAWPVFL